MSETVVELKVIPETPAPPAPLETGDIPTEGVIEDAPPPVASRFFPRPLIFLHIPKAAGTTLQDYILRHYKPGGKFFRFTGHQDQLSEFARFTQAERDAHDVLCGHVHFGIHDSLTQPATYLTMLRDPVERIISHYYFILAHPEHYLHPYVAGRGYSLHEYATAGLNQEGDNDHVRWLTARPHEEVPLGQVTRAMLEEAKWNLQNAVTVFGLADRFTDSLRCFAAAFGWEAVKPAGFGMRLNTNAARPKRDQVAPETLDAIRDSNRYDIELYEFAQALFDEQMVRLGVRPVRADVE